MRHGLLICCLLLLAPAYKAAAQEKTASAGKKALEDYSTVLSANPYLWGANAATIGFLDVTRIATVQLGAGKRNGGLRSLEQSSDSFDAEALTESFVRVSDHVSFYGKLGYAYFRGLGMGGPVLMDPEYNPVNFLESTLTDTGVKARELYTLSGGLSYRFNGRWSAGVRMDYEAGDQVKQKDPRFQNSWMDLGVNAGVSFKPSERADFGLALRWRNTLEQVIGGVYGTNDRQYFTYVDKGAFFGIMEQLDGDNNYMSTTNFRPMSNSFYGASLQANFHSADASSSFFNSLEVLWRSGYYGKRSSSSPTYFEYSGLELSYDLAWRLASGSRTHMTRLELAWKPLTNKENSYRYTTPVGQNTVVEYLGSNGILDRNVLAASLGYRLTDCSRKVLGMLPGAEYSLQADLYGRSSTTTLYPYYRRQSLLRADISAGAHGNFGLPRSADFCLSAGGRLLAHLGGGTAMEDGSHASSSSSSLQSFSDYLYRQFEYDTAARVGASLEFGCSWRLRAASISLALEDSFMSMLKTPEHLENGWRNCAMLKIGCNF